MPGAGSAVRLKPEIERLSGRSCVQSYLHERPPIAVAPGREASIDEANDSLQPSPSHGVAGSAARTARAELGDQTLRPPAGAGPIYADTNR